MGRIPGGTPGRRQVAAPGRRLPSAWRTLCGIAFAAVAGTATAPAQDHDTTYYVKYPDLIGIGYFESLRNNQLRIEKLNPGDTSVPSLIDFKTNGSSLGGFVFNYDKLFVAIGFIKGQAEPGRGRSKNTNVALLLKGNRLVLEGYWRNYTGFYDANTFGFKKYLVDTAHYYIDESISNRTFKLKGLYFLKPSKFSFNAAYYGSYRQLHSASSWIINGNFYTGRVKAPNGLIPYYARGLFEDYSTLHRIRVTGFSGGWGWTGNLVLFKRFFLNFLLTLAAEPQWRAYEFDEGYTTHPFHVSVASDLRVSGGYNSKRFFLIVSTINDRTFNENKSLSLSNNFLSVTFTIGYRFRFDNKATQWLKNNKVYRSL